METHLTKKQRGAVERFYERVERAKEEFAPATRKEVDHKAWLAYYEAKEYAKHTLSCKVPSLHLIPDFWHHAYYRTLEDAIEKAWGMQDEKNKTKQSELELEPKEKPKQKSKHDTNNLSKGRRISTTGKRRNHNRARL